MVSERQNVFMTRGQKVKSVLACLWWIARLVAVLIFDDAFRGESFDLGRGRVVLVRRFQEQSLALDLQWIPNIEHFISKWTMNIKDLRFTLSRDPKNSSWLQQKFKALLACSILWRCSSASSLSLRILAWKLSKYRTKFYVPDFAPLVPNSISHVSKIPRYLCNLLGVSGGWRFRGRRHDFVLVRANDSLHVRNWKV